MYKQIVYYVYHNIIFQCLFDALTPLKANSRLPDLPMESNRKTVILILTNLKIGNDLISRCKLFNIFCCFKWTKNGLTCFIFFLSLLTQHILADRWRSFFSLSRYGRLVLNYGHSCSCHSASAMDFTAGLCSSFFENVSAQFFAKSGNSFLDNFLLSAIFTVNQTVWQCFDG